MKSMLFIDGCGDNEYLDIQGPLRYSDDDNTGFWPPGSLHTLSADGHI